MTGSKVLIVKLPELHADVKQLEAFRAYVCDALGAGTLVLPLGTTYAVEEFPALGAVEVAAGNAVPVVIGGKPTEIKLPLAVGQATPRFAGKASSDKADIHARLNRYWSEKGPGSMIKLSEACGLDASKLYLMQRNDGKFDIEHWRAVNAGLDKLGYGGMK